MVFELIGGGVVKAALPKVAGAIATAVTHKLHPTELEKALKVGLQQSGAFDRGQKVNNAVFYHCDDKQADTFLAALLEHPEMQRELQKPLEQDGAPEVAILVQVAKHIAADRILDIPDNTLEPWLKTFANAYFDAITTICFQVAKADYLEQLANWFDDVKFAGVAVPGQDVERAERLAQIFVMPDVEEDGGGRSRLALERSLFEEQGEQGRQGELLQEQRLRAQLERSGRKFSARQLLNQHQKKIVLLGAPGSGKTTLMSFFAVTLAEQQGAIAPAKDTATQGIDRPTEAIDRLAQGTDRDRSQIDRHTEGIDRDPTQIDRLTQGIDRDRSQMQRDRSQMQRDRSQMQRDRSRMQPDTEGLRLDTQGLQTDADALPLPILVRIRDWARTPDVTLPEYARQFAETTMSCKPLPKGFFEHWLNNGRALILLDGLDEVAEEAKRYHLVQCIENFLGQYPLNRAIITSRPAGYKRDFFRTEEFLHYELQPFDDGKIEEFCDRWYTSRVPDKAEAQRRKESLQKALNQQDRIKLLARNPLLLTIIALIHRYQARLPRERYKLYDKAVETLLTAWDDNKELSNQTVLQYLQLDDLRRLMESLAYWIHTQGNTGDREGGTLIDKDELIQKLTQEIKTLKQLKQYEAKAEAERFVKFIRDRTGLLNEQGQDCYAFVHKTFQEYLAAQDINYQADNEDDFEIVLTHVEQHLHDPHWREVFLLLIAQQSPKKAARAIRKVLTANSPHEQWLHRDLLFAGRCLAEDPKGLQGANSQLPSEILTRLVNLEKNEPSQIGEKICSQIFQVLSSLSETTFEHEALELLKNQRNEIEQVRFQEYRAALGEKEEAIAALLFFLEGNSSGMHVFVEDDVRPRAAEALVNIGASSETLMGVLLRLLKKKRYGFRFITILGRLSSTSESVLNTLLPLLENENDHIRSITSYALCNVQELPDEVVLRLILRLEDQNSVVRGSVSEALGNLSNADKRVVAALFRCLEDEETFVCSEAAYALTKLGNGDQRIISVFLSHLENETSNARWKSRSAEALNRLKQNSEEVLSALLLNLDHEDSLVRVSVASALCDLWGSDERRVSILFSCLKDESSWGRKIAIDTLSKLGKKTDLIMPLLVQWIEQHQDEDCVGAGIDALWEIVEGEG